VNKFLRFIKRVSQLLDNMKEPFSPTIKNLIKSPKRQFPISNILNLDETPILFEFNSGYTYKEQGARSVLAKLDRSGWDKRQATPILYIWANGIQRLKPKLIFLGMAGLAERILEKELLGGRLVVSGVIYWSRCVEGSVVECIVYIGC
jgi:hypothetical protein